MTTVYPYKPEIDTLIHVYSYGSTTMRKSTILDDMGISEIRKDYGTDTDNDYIHTTETYTDTIINAEQDDIMVLYPDTIPQFYGINNNEGPCAVATQTSIDSIVVSNLSKVVCQYSNIQLKDDVFRLNTHYPYKVFKSCLIASTYDTVAGEVNTNNAAKTIKFARDSTKHQLCTIVWNTFGQRDFVILNDDVSSPYYGRECELELKGHVIPSIGAGWAVNETPPPTSPVNGYRYTMHEPIVDGSTVRLAGVGDIIPSLPDQNGMYFRDICAPCGTNHGNTSFWALGGYINDKGDSSTGQFNNRIRYRTDWTDPTTEIELGLGIFGKWFHNRVSAYLMDVDNGELETWLNTGVKPASGKIGLRCRSIMRWLVDTRNSAPAAEKDYGTRNFPENYAFYQQSFHPNGGLDEAGISRHLVPMAITETGDRNSSQRSLYIFFGNRNSRSVNQSNSDISIGGTYSGQYLPSNPITADDGVSLHPSYWKKHRVNEDLPLIFGIGKGSGYTSDGAASGGIYWTHCDEVFTGPIPNQHHKEIIWDASVVGTPQQDRPDSAKRIIFLNGRTSDDTNHISKEKGSNSSGQTQELNHGIIGGPYGIGTSTDDTQYYDCGNWANLNHTSGPVAAASIVAKKGGDAQNTDDTGLYGLWSHTDVGNDCRTEASKGVVPYTDPTKTLSTLNSKLQTSGIPDIVNLTASCSWAGVGAAYPGRTYAEKHQNEIVHLGTNVGFLGTLTYLHFTDGYDTMDISSDVDGNTNGRTYLGLVCWAEGYRITDAGTITSTLARTAAESTPSTTDDYEWTCTKAQQGKAERMTGLVLISYPVRTHDYNTGHHLRFDTSFRYDRKHSLSTFLWDFTDASGDPVPFGSKVHEWKYSFDDQPLMQGNGTPLNITDDIRTYMNAVQFALLPAGCYSHHQIVNKDCASEMTWDARDTTPHNTESDWMKAYVPANDMDKLIYSRQMGFAPRWQCLGATTGSWTGNGNQYGSSTWRIEDYHVGNVVYSEVANDVSGFKQFIYPSKVVHPKPTIYSLQNYSDIQEEQLGNAGMEDIWSPNNYYIAKDFVKWNGHQYSGIEPNGLQYYANNSVNPYWNHSAGAPLDKDYKQLMPQNYIFYPKAVKDQLPDEWTISTGGYPEFLEVAGATKNHYYKLNYPRMRYIYMAGLDSNNFTPYTTTAGVTTFTGNINHEWSDNTAYNVLNCFGLIIMNDPEYSIDERMIHHFSCRTWLVGYNMLYYTQENNDAWDDEMEEAKYNEAIVSAGFLNSAGDYEVKVNEDWLIENFQNGYSSTFPSTLRVCFYKAQVTLGDQHLGFQLPDTVYWDAQNTATNPLLPKFLYGNSTAKRSTATASAIEGQGWTRSPLRYSVKSAINYATRGRSTQLSGNMTAQQTEHNFGETDLFNTLDPQMLYPTTNHDGILTNINNTIRTVEENTTYSNVSIYEYNSALGTAQVPDNIDAIITEDESRIETIGGELIWG